MTTMNLKTFEKLIEKDIKWLLKQTRTLERDHILSVLQANPQMCYDKLHCHQGRCVYTHCLCRCERCVTAKYHTSQGAHNDERK